MTHRVRPRLLVFEASGFSALLDAISSQKETPPTLPIVKISVCATVYNKLRRLFPSAASLGGGHSPASN
ncbi:hypothetical protein LMH87_001063 [Akanthomyces muscarius]|uniref:Uncharacterized protein n=1 Tax=Akanthomyces muscarius TaxID=2231603 RepID=A0A9W8QI33_AKAMU|nr:hypothetical protein LMH87_001063 [Akanthomyces muscarius]KAJ4155837.1 hypothetical protein LMH87_001063 [Akanthomyces muscarius]